VQISSQGIISNFTINTTLGYIINTLSVFVSTSRSLLKANFAQVPQKVRWLSRKILCPLTSPGQSSNPQSHWHCRWVYPSRRCFTPNHSHQRKRRCIDPHTGHSMAVGNHDTQASQGWVFRRPCLLRSLEWKSYHQSGAPVITVQSLEDHSEVLNWNVAWKWVIGLCVGHGRIHATLFFWRQ
jgi:hypothetical protein